MRIGTRCAALNARGKRCGEMRPAWLHIYANRDAHGTGIRTYCRRHGVGVRLKSIKELVEFLWGGKA